MLDHILNKRFDNIVNNPVTQDVIFKAPIKAKSLRLTPVEYREEDGYAYQVFEAIR